MKRVTLTVMVFMFVAALATAAFAYGGGRGPGYGPCGRGGAEGAAELNMTPDQTAKFKEMREAQWNEMKPLQQQMFTKRDEIRKLWLEPNPDQRRIAEAQKEMRAIRDQIQDKMTAYRLEALKTLTPEQQEKLKASFAERGFGPGRGRGPGKWGGGAGCFDCGPAGAGPR